MAKHKMLDELIHYCTKCKMDLNHRITLMEDGKPAKVLCLTCKSERKYKDPKKASPKKKTTKKTKKETVLINEQEWKDKLRSPYKTPIKYNIKESFAVDDLLDHPKFGKGLVVALGYPDKIEVYFGDRIKILKGMHRSG